MSANPYPYDYIAIGPHGVTRSAPTSPVIRTYRRSSPRRSSAAITSSVFLLPWPSNGTELSSRKPPPPPIGCRRLLRRPDMGEDRKPGLQQMRRT